MRKLTITILSALAVLVATNASAQSVTATGNVSITIAKVAYISVPSGDVAFNTPTNTDFQAGEIAANNSVAISYGSNAPHDLQVQIDGLGGKSVGDLQWSVDGGSSWTPMATSAANMASNGSGGLNSATADFKMLLDWATDAAGTYSGTITYTVVAN